MRGLTRGKASRVRIQKALAIDDLQNEMGMLGAARVRITEKDGRTYDIASFTIEPPRYTFIDLRGEASRHLIASIAKTETISSDDVEAAPEEAPADAPAIRGLRPPRTEARTVTNPELTLLRYRITKTSGREFDVVSFATESPCYEFVDAKGEVSRHFTSSVAKIDKLSPEEAEASAEKASATFSGWIAPERSPRVKARTTPRTRIDTASAFSEVTSQTPAPPPSPPIPQPVALSNNGAGSSGYSATGLPLYVSPRGGIYHYSKNGNKVYHSRRK